MTQETTTAPEENAASEPLYITGDDRKKNRSDDVMLTQGILCVILALAVFGLKFINQEFQAELLELYEERLLAEPEQFLVKIITAAENWFRK